MKHLTFALVGVLMLNLAAVSFGQSKPAQTAPAASQPATYEGIVLDKCGKPIAGATVRAFELIGNGVCFHMQPLGKLTTGPDGKYSFAHKSGDSYTAFAVAEKDGYAVGFASFKFDYKPGSGRIHMGKPVTTGGIVVDENGKRIAGARVNLYLNNRSLFSFSGGREPAAMVSLPQCEVMAVSTDAKGRFEFRNTPKDNNVGFIVTAPGKATTFYGGPASTTGWDNVEVTLPTEAKLTGILKAKDGGAPIAGATIMAIPESISRYGLPSAVTDKDGKFEIGSLPAGNVVFFLPGKDGQMADWVIASQPVEIIAGKTTDVTLEAIKGGLVEITVLDKDTGKPVAGARVKLEIPASINTGMNSGVANDKGIAVVRVPPGEYRAEAYAFDYDSWGGFGSPPTVNVEEGEIAKAEVKIRPDPLIKGVVKYADGKPVADVTLIVPTIEGVYPKTDAVGKFAFRFHRDLFDGSGHRYSVLVRQAGSWLVGTGEIADPDRKLTIWLDKGLTLRGVVTDWIGRPVKGASVTVAITHDKRMDMPIDEEFITDDQGRYEIPAMPMDKGMGFVLRATAEGHGSGTSADVTIDDKTLVGSVARIVVISGTALIMLICAGVVLLGTIAVALVVRRKNNRKRLASGSSSEK